MLRSLVFFAAITVAYGVVDIAEGRPIPVYSHPPMQYQACVMALMAAPFALIPLAFYMLMAKDSKAAA